MSVFRYGYQGQEVDPETGKPAFQLRLWHARIGRWLTTDPYGQFDSPYLGMGNNPVSVIDPDGGFACIDAEGNSFPCPENYGSYDSVAGIKDAFFDSNMNFLGDANRLETVFLSGSRSVGDSNLQSNILGATSLIFIALQNINVGRLNNSGDLRIYSNPSSGPEFRGNQSTTLYNIGKSKKILGNIQTGLELASYGYKVATSEGKEKKRAQDNFIINGGVAVISYYVPQIGVICTAGSIISNTEYYQQEKHKAEYRANYSPIETPLSKIDGLKPWDGLHRNKNGRVIGY